MRNIGRLGADFWCWDVRVVSKHQNIRLSYHDLHTQSTALAHGLKNLGVAKGNRVAVSLGNNVEFAITTYALFKLGAILVTKLHATKALLNLWSDGFCERSL